MDPLATDGDLAARLGRDLTPDEAARSEALLKDASAKIRSYTGRQFSVVADDMIVLRPVGSHLRLPQTPVTAVTEIMAIGGAGLPDITLPAACWQWDGVDLVELWPINPDVWLSLPTAEWIEYGQWGPDTYRVIYSHGHEPIPDDVVAVCCTMVLRTLTSPTSTEGLVSESIGQYNYQYGQGPGRQSPGPTVKMTDDDRNELAHYRRKASSIQLRVR